MNTLVVGGQVVGKLKGLEDMTELQDTQGIIIGYFTPASVGIPRPPSSRRPRPPRASSAKEVFEHLLKTTNDENRRKELREMIARMEE